MERALHAASEGMSVREAAAMFGVPKSIYMTESVEEFNQVLWAELHVISTMKGKKS